MAFGHHVEKANRAKRELEVAAMHEANEADPEAAALADEAREMAAEPVSQPVDPNAPITLAQLAQLLQAIRGPSAQDIAEIALKAAQSGAERIKPKELSDTFTQARAGGARRHDAIDIMAPTGRPVVAAAPGRVEKIFFSQGGGGKSIVLQLDIDLGIVGVAMLFALIMGAVGGIIPAVSAMRLRPLESLR